jgi:hypothetical protein
MALVETRKRRTPPGLRPSPRGSNTAALETVLRASDLWRKGTHCNSAKVARIIAITDLANS